MTIRSYPLKFRPIAKERIWGGRHLTSYFQLDEPGEIGEVWTLSDHPNGTSVCINGPFAGQTLTDIVANHPKWYLGKRETSRFPLLIKFIHAEQDLSVQIHPEDAYAKEHEDDWGKTEAWYILEAEDGAQINYGHTFPDKTTYLRAVAQGNVSDYLNYRAVRPDDFVFVPARTLHALMRGVMLIEIQQTSDVTYRVYDWDRVDSQGKSRALHVDKAADVLHYDQRLPTNERKVLREEPGLRHEHLVQCPYFTIDKWEVSQNATITSGKCGQPDVLIVAHGEGTLHYRHNGAITLRQGDTVLIPSDFIAYTIRAHHGVTLLRAY